MNRAVSRRRAALISAGISVAVIVVILATYGWRLEAKIDVVLELNTPPANASLKGTTMEIPEGNAAIVTAVTGRDPYCVHATVSGIKRYRLTLAGFDMRFLASEWATRLALAETAGVPESAIIRLSGSELFD